MSVCVCVDVQCVPLCMNVQCVMMMCMCRREEGWRCTHMYIYVCNFPDDFRSVCVCVYGVVLQVEGVSG